MVRSIAGYSSVLRCEEVIPDFDENGNLPPGVHFCEWEEFVERYIKLL